MKLRVVSSMRRSIAYGIVILVLLCCPYVFGEEMKEVSKSPFGINVQFVYALYHDIMDSMQSCGIHWLRLPVDWYAIEPKDNIWNWTLLDSIVRMAGQRQMDILAVLRYTPRWASVAPESDRDNFFAYPPRGPGLWADFVGTIVERYDGDGARDMPGLERPIRHWGIWNEPNGDTFRGTPEDYREKILKVAYGAAKRSDSTSMILAPELAHVLSEPNRWEGFR